MDTNPKVRLIVDLSSLPKELSLEQYFNILVNSGIAIYDSTLGNPPTVLAEGITIKDVGFLEKKEFLEKYEELMKEPKDDFSYMNRPIN